MNGTLSRLSITAEFTDDENADKRTAYLIEMPITGLSITSSMALEEKFKSLYMDALALERSMHGRKPI